MRHIFLFLSLLVFLTLPSLSFAENTDPKILEKKTIGKLTCFSIIPPEKQEKRVLSCDELCAKQEAVCTGVQSHTGPPPTCADPIFVSYGSCRCCVVKS